MGLFYIQVFLRSNLSTFTLFYVQSFYVQSFYFQSSTFKFFYFWSSTFSLSTFGRSTFSRTIVLVLPGFNEDVLSGVHAHGLRLDGDAFSANLKDHNVLSELLLLLE